MPDDAELHAVHVTVNGTPRDAVVPGARLLVHLLREDLGLSGTHIGCDTGTCGACSIRVDGRLVKSCMMLAAQVDGCAVTTVEGLAPGPGELSPLQEAFSAEHALQCGYCTPGMLMAAGKLLEDDPDPGEPEIRRALNGNLCRCTGYHNIVRAVRRAADAQAGAPA